MAKTVKRIVGRKIVETPVPVKKRSYPRPTWKMVYAMRTDIAKMDVSLSIQTDLNHDLENEIINLSAGILERDRSIETLRTGLAVKEDTIVDLEDHVALLQDRVINIWRLENEPAVEEPTRWESIKGFFAKLWVDTKSSF